jgi:hypothetical protein
VLIDGSLPTQSVEAAVWQAVSERLLAKVL